MNERTKIREANVQRIVRILFSHWYHIVKNDNIARSKLTHNNTHSLTSKLNIFVILHRSYRNIQEHTKNIPNQKTIHIKAIIKNKFLV